VHFYNDTMTTIDRGEIGALVLLDMTAAFNTTDHGITLDVLQRRYGVGDDALDWFEHSRSSLVQTRYLSVSS